MQFGKDKLHAAYWFKKMSPDHIHFQVVRETHIKEIVDDPAAFDESVQLICDDYRHFEEIIGAEGQASRRILARALSLDFIRVRTSAELALVTCQQGAYKTKELRATLYWVIFYLSKVASVNMQIKLLLMGDSGEYEQSYSFKAGQIIKAKQIGEIGGYQLGKPQVKSPTIWQMSFGLGPLQLL